MAMDPRRPPEFTLEIFADPQSVKEVVRGILHTIFFHRYFPTLRPSTIDVLDLTLPYVTDLDLESVIDTRVYQLTRQLAAGHPASPPNSARGQLGVQFFEKKRKPRIPTPAPSNASSAAAGALAWLGGASAGAAPASTSGPSRIVEEDVCWETWRLEVTLATPRTEAEQKKVLRAMETTLHRTALKIVAIVNQHKDHIPPITTSETNPFPYQVVLNPRVEGWTRSIGLH